MKNIKEDIIVKPAKKDKTIRQHTDELKSSLNLLKDYKYVPNELYHLIKICCEYHDYGKVNAQFTKRIESKKKIPFDSEKEVAHNVLSLCFIKKDMFKKIEDYYRVCYAVLNHHHNGKNFEEIREKKELIKSFAEEYGEAILQRSTINKLIDLKTDTEAQLIKGFLHKCDYAASGEYKVEYQNNFLSDSLDNLGYKWNELQIFCYNNKDENIVVIANTGMGKTEAGLRWIDNNKGFFILPLRTAINAIYDRVVRNIVKENITERVSLLHSEAVSYYLKEAMTEDEKILEYSNKGKSLSMPLTISTPDQLFDFVYKYNGFELKLATLSYSKLVIDEIQAYSPDLLAYLITGLEKMVEVGGKFAILTATLPPFVLKYLEENISTPKFEKFTVGKDRHYLQVQEKEIDVKLIEHHYKEFQGKTLVICNTVKKAQKVYDELIEAGLKNELNLIHAKFTKEHRKRKEDSILTFGDTEIKGNGIWIATSIVEASLDIDFDYLFTELNDLNGLFQRLGRVNRKGNKSNMLDKPNAYVFTEIEKGLLISKDGTRGFIDKTIHELSKEALKNFNDILSEEKKVDLIERYLTVENIKYSNFDDRYHKTKNYINSLYIGEKNIEDVQRYFRDIISHDVIPFSIYEKNKKVIEVNAEIMRTKFKKDKNLSTEENDRKRNQLKLEKIKAKEKIYNFVVSVGYYDKRSIKSTVDLAYDRIEIVDCNYSFERGFERIKVEKVKEFFDAFL